LEFPQVEKSSLKTLHARYRVQARWTQPIRRRLLDQIELIANLKILEVGSGTGCITHWMAKELDQVVYGIDIDGSSARFAQEIDPSNGYAQADGAALPFPQNTFQLTFCHYLLLWTPQPLHILTEMRRCTRPGGWVVAFAEPDYRGRIDFPERLVELGELQSRALSEMGVEIQRGRQLRKLMLDAGLADVHCGLIGGEWDDQFPPDLDSEWETLRSDLAGYLTPAQLSEFEHFDRKAWVDQERILYIPTFYAIGQKAPNAQDD
jgi:ubiquinone/menaquinone biosynthesis C-methylase UbiE